MLLSSIEIQGFKSFADKTVLRFGKGITAVVGPNGSGKSNLNDAVRWVLGEQSTKSLRGQSMEDVIFGGTAERRPHGFCEVTLNIDNSDRSLNFDNDSVSITRRYYRSHESEYLINNVSVRLKDVNELFMDTGIGRDGYSMIGQGKIDSIISSKSDERRDIFEEAAGISKYRYRKIEAERKLKAAQENLLRLNDIMSELSGRVGPLKQQSEKATRFLELSEGRKELEIGLWLYALENSKETMRNHENKITTAEYQYNQIEKKLEEFELQIDANSAEFARQTAEIDRMRAMVSEYDETIATKNGEIAVLRNDIMHNAETVARLQEEINDFEGSDERARLEIAERIKRAEELDAAAQALKSEADNAQLELSGLLSDSDNISRKIEEKTNELNAISALIADARVRMVTAKTSLSELGDRKQNIEAVVSGKREELECYEKELTSISELVKSLGETVDSAANSLKGYELRLESRKKSADEAKQKVEELSLEIESKKRRAQMLSDLEKNMEGFSIAVKAVMKEAENGTLRGICGPVSRLIRVSKEYTTAIETALGSAMQNIVVDTEADGKRAISMLKSASAGRATFLPVSSMKARSLKEQGVEDCFGFVGIASELVECDKKYSGITGNLLGNTVIAEDLDSAVAIAKKYSYHFRVVSLDGQVVNAGGSFTGGSHIKNAGLLSRASEVERILADAAKLEEKLEVLNSLYNEAVSAVSAVEAEILSARSELQTATEDKIRAEGEQKRVNELILAASFALESYESDMLDQDKKSAILTEEMTTALQQISDLDIRKTAAEAELGQVTGGRDAISEKRDELTDKITDLRLKMTETIKDAEAVRATVKLEEDSIGNRAERIVQCNNQIEICNEASRELEASIAAIEREIANIREMASENGQNVDSLIKQREETEQLGQQLRVNERETTLQRENISGELARLRERGETMRSEYDSVIKQLFDEYQLTRSEAEEMHIDIGNPAEAKKRLAEIKSAVRALGSVNVAAIDEYKEVSERYEFLKGQIDDIEASRSELNRLIGQLTTQMKEIFLDGFARIGENFSKTFTDLFGGGSAKLVLTDPDNVLESGIDIVAKLPGKNVPSLDGLSGGEKAMTALSIYFAIMRVSPPPFCFLDEVDTALDDINVDRFADYMKRSDFNTQFICVSHRRGTMESADMLYGVTMQEKGVSKLLELNISELEKKLKLETEVR